MLQFVDFLMHMLWDSKAIIIINIVYMYYARGSTIKHIQATQKKAVHMHTLTSIANV